MTPRRFLIAGSMLLCALAPQALHAQKEVETLLKDATFMYSLVEDGSYKVPIEFGDETIMVYMWSGTLYKGSKAEGPYLTLYTRALTLPKHYAPTIAFLTAMAKLNDYIPFGSYSLSADNTSIFCNTTLWLKGAAPSTLYQHCLLVNEMRLECRRQLLPLLKED